jgi:hypothetical protein
VQGAEGGWEGEREQGGRGAGCGGVGICVLQSALEDQCLLTRRFMQVEHTIIGGPAHKIIQEGDTIVRVDNQPVTPDNIAELLLGNDVPGSIVQLTVQDNQQQLNSVHLARMDSALIADKRLLFEQFTHMQVLGGAGCGVRGRAGVSGRELRDVQHSRGVRTQRSILALSCGQASRLRRRRS